jgi:hypothetical protein
MFRILPNEQSMDDIYFAEEIINDFKVFCYPER